MKSNPGKEMDETSRKDWEQAFIDILESIELVSKNGVDL